MIRKLSLAVAAMVVLSGCMTGYGYRGGSGDYYYGRPSADYYYRDGYGYPGGYYSGYYDYRYGYGGYGYPYYGYHGGYGYPYYPYRPRPQHPRPPTSGGRLPPRDIAPPPGAGQSPNTQARPSLIDGGRSKREGNLGGLRRDVGDAAAIRAPSGDTRLRSLRQAAPAAPPASRAVVPASRVETRRAPESGRGVSRPNLSRPPASRERDIGQQVER